MNISSSSDNISFFGAKARGLFPAFKENSRLVYLDSAATSLKPYALIEATEEIMAKRYGTVHRSLYQLAASATERFESSRQKMWQWLGGSENSQVIFTKGTTDAINLLAYGLEDALSEGDEVVVSSLDHHSNWVPWQLLCARKNLTFRILEIDPAKSLQDQVLEKLSPRTKILAITHMPNTTGLLLDWSSLIAQAKAFGAWIVMDGAQAMSTGPCDLSTLGCDFYAFSLHKLYGPTGLGILWGKKESLEKLRPRDSGGEMVDQVGDALTTFAPLPLRLEAGTPAIIEVLSLEALLDWWNQPGMSALKEHKEKLAQYTKERLSQFSQVRVISSHPKSTLVLFDIQGAHPMDVSTLLDLEGVCLRSGHMCAQPALRRMNLNHALRVSFGVYNDKNDIDCFIAALEKIIPRLF